MGRNGKFSLLLLLLFVSDASFFGRSRKLVDQEALEDDSSTKQNSPVPSPSPDSKSLSDTRPTGDEKSSNNSSNPDPKGLDKSTDSPLPMQPANEKNDTKVIIGTEPTSLPPSGQTDREENEKGSDKIKRLSPPPPVPPPPKSPESRKNDGELAKGSPPPAKNPGKGNDGMGKSQAGTETCPETSSICRDKKSLVACTLSVDRGSSKWLILVQNEGEGPLRGNIIVPASTIGASKELTMSKHQSERVNISITRETEKVIVDAGNGECILHMDGLVSEENNIFIHFPSYEKLATPINGAYMLIVTVVVLGGTWGCCLLRKKRRGEDIPYQELEMGRTGGDVETAEGWDEGWDDEWDEGNAVKSPGGGGNVKNISANGLTARASSRDGWENDWDD